MGTLLPVFPLFPLLLLLLMPPCSCAPLPPTSGPQHTYIISINASSKAEMFFWLFEAGEQQGREREEIPLILWLEGGPGISGLFQVFYGMGPYRINSDFEVSLNPYTWNKKYHLLFVDNPCGCGYSSVQEGGEVRNQEKMAEELYAGLIGFFGNQPLLLENPFYVFGESYGGKYGPAIVEYIHRQNQVSAIKINLIGMGLGNPLVNTPVQIASSADFYSGVGLQTEMQKEKTIEMQELFQKQFDQGDFYGATGTFWDILYRAAFSSGFNFYNYNCDADCMQGYNWTLYEIFLNRQDVKDQLGVSNLTFISVSYQVSGALYPDVCQSIAHLFPSILEHSKVLIYHGLFDSVVNPLGSERWLNLLEWEGIEGFKRERRVWWVDEGSSFFYLSLAGLVRRHRTLTEALVYGAGHFVTIDQPKRALDLVERFIEDLPWEPEVPIPTPPLAAQGFSKFQKMR